MDYANYVYDINVQDVNHNINIVNYPMYNATANNDYDSYPTPEEYKKKMLTLGQINYAYAGGDFIKGIPMSSQMPVYKTLKTLGNHTTSSKLFNKFKTRNMNEMNFATSQGYNKTEGTPFF